MFYVVSIPAQNNPSRTRSRNRCQPRLSDRFQCTTSIPHAHLDRSDQKKTPKSTRNSLIGAGVMGLNRVGSFHHRVGRNGENHVAEFSIWEVIVFLENEIRASVSVLIDFLKETLDTEGFTQVQEHLKPCSLISKHSGSYCIFKGFNIGLDCAAQRYLCDISHGNQEGIVRLALKRYGLAHLASV